jgi:DNA-binding NarL/FixJ family response regulator
MGRRAVGTVIVGPTTLLRGAIAKILRPPDFRVVLSTRSISDIESIELSQDRTCLLIIETDGTLDSLLTHITRFKQRYPLGRVFLLGHRWHPEKIAAAFEAGANACFTPASDSHELLKAIELIMMGSQTILPVEFLPCLSNLSSPSNTDRVRGGWSNAATESRDNQAVVVADRESSHLHFSSRELSIIRCLVGGATNKAIAREINISEATVKVHVKAILRKIGISNRTQAAIWAMTNSHLVV